MVERIGLEIRPWGSAVNLRNLRWVVYAVFPSLDLKKTNHALYGTIIPEYISINSAEFGTNNRIVNNISNHSSSALASWWQVSHRVVCVCCLTIKRPDCHNRKRNTKEKVNLKCKVLSCVAAEMMVKRKKMKILPRPL